MAVRVEPAIESAVRRALLAGMSLRVAAKECGTNPGVVQRILRDMRREGLAESIVAAPGVPLEEPGESRVWDERGDTATVTVRTPEEVRTEADAIRVCGVDTSRWKVVGQTIKTYQVGMKLADKEEAASGQVRRISERPHVVQLYGVTLKLALIAPRPYLDALDLRYERLATRARDYPAPPAASATAPYLVHMGLFDAHFGKLCWNPETGQDFDLRIAEAVYRNAADDLLRLLSPYPVGRFVLPVGNDLFHVDTLRNTTTAGTVVDADSRYPKMIDIGTEAVVQLIERLHDVAPVDVVYVPGNHDHLASYHLCRELAREFRRAPGVSVDVSPRVRKYRRYGRVLFGWRHGDLVTDAGLRDLPGLMAVEAAEDWSKAACREWFLGHRHTSRKFTTRESDEILGVQVRYLSSLSGTDAWHFENGYVGNRRAAECYLYSLDSGYTGHFVAPARS